MHEDPDPVPNPKPVPLIPYLPLRYLSLLLLACCMACSTTDEGPAPDHGPLPQDIPRLESLLAGGDIDDMTRLKIYNRLVLKLRGDRPHRAGKYAALQLILAGETDNPEYAGKALYLLGLMDKEHRDYNSAIVHYLQAIDRFDIGDIKDRLGDCYNNIGNVFLQTGMFDVAIPYFEKAVEYYEASNYGDYKLLALENLAVCHRKKESPDFATASKIYSQVIQSILNHKDIDYLSLIDLSIDFGVLKFNEEKYREAVEQYALALTYTASLPSSDEHRARLYANMTEAYMYMGEEHYATAGDYLRKLQSLDRPEQRSSKHEIQILNIQGELAHRLGEYERALSLCDRAIALADKEVVNPPLLETVALKRKVQRAYGRKGGPVAIEDSWRMEDLEEQQDRLRRAFEGRLDSAELRAILLRTVDGHHAHREAVREAKERRERHARVLLVLLLVFSVPAYYLIRYVQRHLREEKRLRKLRAQARMYLKRQA